MQPKVISRHPHIQIFMVMPVYLSVEDSALLLQTLGKLIAIERHSSVSKYTQ
jgi:hypothetical protein